MAVFSKMLQAQLGSRLGLAFGAGSLVIIGAVVRYLRQARAAQLRNKKLYVISKNKTKKERVAVNGAFFGRLLNILKILIPSVRSAEVGYILLVACSLLARTYADLWLLANNTATERAIISRNPTKFRHHLTRFFLAMVPISVVNNALKYGLNELHIRFRRRLTTHLYDQYMDGYVYYQLTNVDNRVSNPDQLLAQDVDKFTQGVVDLYSNTAKPLVDVLLYAYTLTGSIGKSSVMMMFAYMAFSAVVLTRLRRPTARYTVQEQELEGDFRYVNSRLIIHSEEVAFYNGGAREASVIRFSFERLMSLLKESIQFRALIGLVDTIIAKYAATVVGFFVLSRPFLNHTYAPFLNLGTNELMEIYYRNGRMLINMAGAIGRLVLSGRELTRLAGFTVRISQLRDVLGKLSRQEFRKPPQGTLVPNSGKVTHSADGLIRFDEVPIVTPTGDVLIDSMSFEVKPGMNVLIAGPNGSGKSSLFRTLGELWPLFGGHMTKPPAAELFYLPQRSYLVLGTLRDQITYPHTHEEMTASGHSDDLLRELLSRVKLDHLLDIEGGLDAVHDWQDRLSGGEKQRVAMARLFYHRPTWAILDECTSATSVDVEGAMYEYCQELGINLFTVSQRRSLWQYHSHVLRFHVDGPGTYAFTPIADAEVFGS